MSDKVILSAKQLRTGYDKTPVLKDISFSLTPGTLTGLLGANGSGKTTLLKALCGLLPYTGNCSLYDTPLKQLSTREIARKVSYIPQRSGITLSIPVLDVVLMGFNPVLKLFEKPAGAHKEAARCALSAVGLSGFEARDYLTLSEGQKQLCILARTLVENTKLLLLDEPDSALDFRNRYLFMQTLRHMVKEEHKAGLICLHDPAAALEFCDRIILLTDGVCESISPDKDPIPDMEAALTKVYGPLSIAHCQDRKNKEHLILFSELCGKWAHNR